jgi:flagellar biosynthesis GTPase FlhF
MFPVIGPLYSIFSAIVVIVVFIVHMYEVLHGSRKTVFVSSVIAMVGCIETVAIWFNLYVALFQEKYKYAAFCLVALVVTYGLNAANFYFVRDKVMAEDATKREKLKPAAVKEIKTRIVKQERRKREYKQREEMIQKKIEHEEKKLAKERKLAKKRELEAEEEAKYNQQEEGGSLSASHTLIEMAVLEKYRGTSSSSDSEYYEGGKKDKKNKDKEDEKLLKGMTEEQMERYLSDDKIDVVEETICCLCCKRKSGKKSFYRTKPIHDGGFDKWVQAND